MTAAQTKARARFKAAVKEAAKLRAKDPKLSQADAVKKAWAMLYGKKVGATPKKTATKKTGKQKSQDAHTDTKSHNVNIRVVSGTPVKTAVKKALRAAGKRLKHGYATVPGTVRKLSGYDMDGERMKLISRRTFLEDKINNLNKDLYFTAHGISLATPADRKKFSAYKKENRKMAASYAKEYKLIVKRLDKFNKV